MPHPPSLLCLSFLKGICVCFSARLAILACLLLTHPHSQAQTPPRHKLFTSPEDGVAFSYPTTWLLDDDDDAATAKLRLADLAPAHAVVQLEGNFTGEGPYKDTDFDAGAFAYTLVPAETEAACFAVLDHLSTRPPTPSTLDHRPAREANFVGTVAGTEDIHHIVAVFQQQRCILLETVLIRRSADTVVHPLSPGRWRQLANAFDTALRSVHFL